jgi:hypothetical protein
MDYEKMELDELKNYAKTIGITFGNIGKEKLLEKIKEKDGISSAISSVLIDNELEDNLDSQPIEVIKEKRTDSIIDSISSVIDDLDDAVDDVSIETVDLPMDTVINVKSITFGGLTYKSRTTNAVFRWNQIGSIQPMTVAEINEMNNYKTDFLRRPLVVLMDERAIKKFRLTSVYENVAKINNLTAVFNSDLDKISKWLDDVLNVNMRDILISKVRQMYKNKKLVDINIIRLLEHKLKFDLSDDNQ